MGRHAASAPVDEEPPWRPSQQATDEPFPSAAPTMPAVGGTSTARATPIPTWPPDAAGLRPRPAPPAPPVPPVPTETPAPAPAAATPAPAADSTVPGPLGSLAAGLVSALALVAVLAWAGVAMRTALVFAGGLVVVVVVAAWVARSTGPRHPVE